MVNNLDQRKIWLERILLALDNLSYGSVQITVQDGRIVQIERTEKERFSPELGVEKGKQRR